MKDSITFALFFLGLSQGWSGCVSHLSVSWNRALEPRWQETNQEAQFVPMQMTPPPALEAELLAQSSLSMAAAQPSWSSRLRETSR